MEICVVYIKRVKNIAFGEEEMGGEGNEECCLF